MNTPLERFDEETGVSHETLTRLERYAELLRLWNPKINLVGPATLPELWSRHFLDSAQLFPLLPPGRLVDLGSGAGFPGLVLAVMGRADTHLIESDQRKSVFLREVSRETGADATIHAKRIEDVPPLGAAVVTARALAALTRLVPWAFLHLAPGGQMLFLKGAELDAELEELATGWHFTAERIPSRTAPDGAIVRLTGISRR